MSEPLWCLYELGDLIRNEQGKWRGACTVVVIERDISYGRATTLLAISPSVWEGGHYRIAPMAEMEELIAAHATGKGFACDRHGDGTRQTPSQYGIR